MDYSIQYERFHPDAPEHAEAMSAALAAHLRPLLPAQPDGPIVDIGCGYGFAMRAVQQLGFSQVEGVETSPQQAQRARRHGFRVEVVEDSIGWLEARPAQFSVVLLLDVLEHVPVDRQLALLRSIARSLRPNGRLIIQVPNASGILAARWLYTDFTHHSSFTEHSLDFALRNAGFDRIQMAGLTGIGHFHWRLWRADHRARTRKFLVRWLWLQVYKAEVPWEPVDDISFELNLTAVAYPSAASPTE